MRRGIRKPSKFIFRQPFFKISAAETAALEEKDAENI